MVRCAWSLTMKMKMASQRSRGKKELTLLVEEDVQEDWNMDMPEDVDASGQAASEANNKLLLAGGGAVLVAVIAAAVFTVKFIKKRKEAKQQKDDENEIS